MGAPGFGDRLNLGRQDTHGDRSYMMPLRTRAFDEDFWAQVQKAYGKLRQHTYIPWSLQQDAYLSTERA